VKPKVRTPLQANFVGKPAKKPKVVTPAAHESPYLPAFEAAKDWLNTNPHKSSWSSNGTNGRSEEHAAKASRQPNVATKFNFNCGAKNAEKLPKQEDPKPEPKTEVKNENGDEATPPPARCVASARIDKTEKGFVVFILKDHSQTCPRVGKERGLLTVEKAKVVAQRHNFGGTRANPVSSIQQACQSAARGTVKVMERDVNVVPTRNTCKEFVKRLDKELSNRANESPESLKTLLWEILRQTPHDPYLLSCSHHK